MSSMLLGLYNYFLFLVNEKSDWIHISTNCFRSFFSWFFLNHHFWMFGTNFSLPLARSQNCVLNFKMQNNPVCGFQNCYGTSSSHNFKCYQSWRTAEKVTNKAALNTDWILYKIHCPFYHPQFSLCSTHKTKEKTKDNKRRLVV